jgi:hypothetical protein
MRSAVHIYRITDDIRNSVIEFSVLGFFFLLQKSLIQSAAHLTHALAIVLALAYSLALGCSGIKFSLRRAFSISVNTLASSTVAGMLTGFPAHMSRIHRRKTFPLRVLGSRATTNTFSRHAIAPRSFRTAATRSCLSVAGTFPEVTTRANGLKVQNHVSKQIALNGYCKFVQINITTPPTYTCPFKLSGIGTTQVSTTD